MYAQGQELYVYTEPASNMAAKSIGFRLTNSLMQQVSNKEQYNFHSVPELMIGISKKSMLHGQVFLSNRNTKLITEGGALYYKYRFFSVDEVNKHFRMAAYTRLSYNISDVHQPAIDLFGHNSGVETGVIATQLIKKVALSASLAHMYAADNGKGNKFIYANNNRNAVGYTLSVGKLMLPKTYTSYNQTNMNLMVEMLGQTNWETGSSFLDLAPSLQLILFSKMRIDVGYRFPMINDLKRTADRGFLLRLEYNIFNAF